MPPRTPLNVADLAWTRSEHGERYASERKALTAKAGARDLGASVYRVPPGKAAFPAHFHHANEEHIYVLAGEGTLRVGEAETPLRVGDYVALPAGGPAHQVRNTGAAPLEYLCVSTMRVPDVSEYPDSRKLGVFTGAAPGGDKAARRLSGFWRASDAVDYYADEPDGPLEEH